MKRYLKWKNTLDGTNCSSAVGKEKISELEDVAIQTTQSET